MEACTHSSRDNQSIMTSFILMCTVWLTICVGLLSAEPKIPVSGKVRSTVVLPCTLKVRRETPYVRWSTDKDVFERSGKESFQGEGYEGRVDIPEEQLLKGDCSLVLHNLTLTDNGVYKSYQVVRRTKRSAVREKWDLISSVVLSVDGTSASIQERNEKTNHLEPSVPISDARVNWPRAQVMALSLLSLFLFQLFYKQT
ncbi:butyrophilin subfamily 2 member A2-like isoform X2 [Neoarius graeffei]|uniref:butyrophilin subfamily 2 member A2-like isoform X2 n=1 Tax=Neoarius graeffei TaxID=443677 RepID=UPI00298D2DD0|nr:butyrophilin subfamily 2 member A2-like isoform X2 [Neoarius graeffei]